MSEFIIDTDKMVKEKLEMLGSLEDIQIATKLLDEASGGGEENLIDTNYKKLKCDIQPIDRNVNYFWFLFLYIARLRSSKLSKNMSKTLMLVPIQAIA